MTVLPNTVSITSMPQISPQKTPARRLAPEAKKAITLDALSGMGIAQAAKKNAVCRNSVYAQKTKAEAALEAAFADTTDATVLFYLPVSKHFICQVVLGLVLIAKASYRDVMQFLHDLFDYPISLGTVAGIVDGCGFHTGHAATRTALRSGRRMSSIAGPHRSLSASERS